MQNPYCDPFNSVNQPLVTPFMFYVIYNKRDLREKTFIYTGRIKYRKVR
jgi:hypothetical protein